MKNLEKITSKNLRGVSAYVPGEQPRGGGWVKLNTNELPYAPSPKVAAAVLKELGKRGESLRLYPDPSSLDYRKGVAKYFKLRPENVIAGNGSDDILNLAFRAFSGASLPALALEPSYSLYPVLAAIQGSKLLRIPFGKNMEIDMEALGKSRAGILFFTNPNAPTGVGFSEDVLEKILKKFKGLVLVDEAYAPFAKYSAAKFVKKYDNILVTGTLSKGWGMAGMRVGWGLAAPKVIETLDKVRDSYNLDRLSQVAGLAAISDASYHKKVCGLVVAEREKIQKFFDALNWNYWKSLTNFVLVEPKNSEGKSGSDVASELFEFLKKNKILVRYFANDKSVNARLRVTVGSPAQMNSFKKCVKNWLAKK